MPGQLNQNPAPPLPGQVRPENVSTIQQQHQPPGFPSQSQSSFPSQPTPYGNQPPLPSAENTQRGYPSQPQMPGLPHMPPPGSYPPIPQQPGFPPQPTANYSQSNFPPQPNRQPYGQPGYNQTPGQQAAYNQAPGQYPPGMAAPPQRRLDPDQMPNPIQVMTENQTSLTGPFVTNEPGLVPPLVTTNFVTHDQGNSGPRYIRSTMYSVPATADMMKQTAVPFSLIISPLAQTVEGEISPPIVDFGEIGPIRCIRCKAYMSPNMQFIDGGRRFRCLMCKATSDGKNNNNFQNLPINSKDFLFI